jgi:hypothetical protein
MINAYYFITYLAVVILTEKLMVLVLTEFVGVYPRKEQLNSLSIIIFIATLFAFQCNAQSLDKFNHRPTMTRPLLRPSFMVGMCQTNEKKLNRPIDRRRYHYQSSISYKGL